MFFLAVGTTSSAQQSTKTYTYDALGRLVSSVTSGGQNDGQAYSSCFDDGHNRTAYEAVNDGSIAACVDIGTVGGTPDPDPDPGPTNSPPVTANDSAIAYCNTPKTINLTANDSDPEGNTPLRVTSLTKTSGAPILSYIVSASSVSVTAATGGARVFSYTVEDSLGASAQGHLTVTILLPGCSQPLSGDHE